MLKYITLLVGVLMLLLCGSVGAVTHTITSIPTTIPSTWSGDTVYISGTKISSVGYGITFAAGCQNILLDGQGDTIVFGTATSPTTGSSPVQGDLGIVLSGTNIRNITIRDLYVHHQPDAPGYDSTAMIWAIALRLGFTRHNNRFPFVVPAFSNSSISSMPRRLPSRVSGVLGTAVPLASMSVAVINGDILVMIAAICVVVATLFVPLFR